MAKRKNTTSKSRESREHAHRRPPFFATVTIILVLIVLYATGLDGQLMDIIDGIGQPSYSHVPGEGLYVRFLDVGKADSMLIVCDGETMLVDAGELETAGYVVDYLKRAGVRTLDAIVATHPHSDHIGGMASAIEEFNPIISYISPKTHNTNTYLRMMAALDINGGEVIVPKPGERYQLGGADIEFVAPHMDYDEINDCSLVFVLEYQGIRIMFTGDAQSDSEKDMRESGLRLDADVLKVGHHGSNTSSKKAFLQEVSPRYAIITQADIADSSDKVLDRLADINAQVYSTDNGVIILSVEGGVIKISQ